MICTSSPWHAYAAHNQSMFTGQSSPPARMEWGTHAGAGPGAAVFGSELRGRKILELGCGPGHNAAHLAGCHRAQVTAVDLVSLQIQRAQKHYGHLAGLSFFTHDALRFLRVGKAVFDAVYSVFGAIGLTDPLLLLPALARRLRPHGILAFSVPHPDRREISKARGPQPRPDVLHLGDGSRHHVPRWEFDEPDWRRLLSGAGLRATAITEWGPPGRARPTTLMITARRN